MAVRSVRAVKHDDGSFEPLERVDLPTGAVVRLVFEAPEETENGRLYLPAWPGTVIGPLTRAEIYDHL